LFKIVTIDLLNGWKIPVVGNTFGEDVGEEFFRLGGCTAS
jgi:hypothetical protein